MSAPDRASSQFEPVALTDVSSFQQLKTYAATAQVAYLNRRRPGVRAWLQSDIAHEWYKRKRPEPVEDVADLRAAADRRRGDNATRRKASSNLTRRLRAPSLQFLQDFDATLLDLVPDMSRAGGLAGFAARLSGVRNAKEFGFVVPILYEPAVLTLRSPPPIFVLEQATVLLTKFERTPQDADDIQDAHQEILVHVVDDLIRIGGLPPTPYSVDALLALGGLSRFAFPLVKQRLARALRTPLGFRVWRAITAVVTAIKTSDEERTATGHDVRNWVMHQLVLSDRLREYSLYPARSLDLEVAIVVPASWSSPDGPSGDWAGDLLRRRARDPNCTLRERGTAAFGLWERAIDGHYEDIARNEVLALIDEFREEGRTRLGLSWVAGTLQQNVDAGKKILTTWPDLGESCQAVIKHAARQLDETIPDRIRAATAILFEHAVIKNAGVYRRRAIDTLRAGGWSAEILPSLRAVLKHRAAEPWLRCRALFAIGFLQEHNEQVQGALREACEDAWRRLQAKPDDTTAAVAEMHAALFAVGDCFGTPDAGHSAHQIREQIDPILTEVVDAAREQEGALKPIGRALAYLLATTAHAQSAAAKTMLELLAKLPDPPTQQMSHWGLQRLRHFPDTVVPAHEVEFEAFADLP